MHSLSSFINCQMKAKPLSSHHHSQIILKQIPAILAFHLQIFPVYLLSKQKGFLSKHSHNILITFPEKKNSPFIIKYRDVFLKSTSSLFCNWVIFLSMALGIFSLKENPTSYIKIAK